MDVEVDDARFRRKLEEYWRSTGRAVSAVLKGQARLLAERLMRLTYPAKSSDGTRRVEIDINRVYLRNSWWEDKFQFTDKRLGDRIVNLVRAANQADLEEIFRRSAKLNRIRIGPFEKSRHEAARRSGRVKYPAPFSYPLAQQQQVEAYAAEKKRAVGTAKGGWGRCLALLGGKPPRWASKGGLGGVEDRSGEPTDPHITITNKAAHFAALDAEKGIVGRALAGRARDMIKAVENQLRRAAKSSSG